MITITPELVRVAAPACADPQAAAQALQAACRAQAFPQTREAVAMLLAQLGHESELNPVEEALHYSAQRLCQVWPGRFPSLAAAQPYARNPEALANRVYGGRMGNTQPGDGYRYRGRGYIQVTGRGMYRDLGTACGLPLEAQPDLLLTPAASAAAALAFLARRGLVDDMARGDVYAVTRGINGGVNGLADRQARYARVLAAMPAVPAQPRVFFTRQDGARVQWDGRPTVYGWTGINEAWVSQMALVYPPGTETVVGNLHLTVAADGALVLARA